MTTPFESKHSLFTQFARIGRAIASASRLELLDLLMQGEKSVETLSRQTGLAITNTSNHLKELRAASLVTTRRDGPRIFYRVADPSVQQLIRLLQEVAHRQLAEVGQVLRDYIERPDDLEPIEADDLIARLRSGDVVMLDVRPDDEYVSGHVPGAVSIPVGELERRIAELPADREIIAYCRGPYCVLAVRAVEILRARGLRARRMEEGIPDWRARGFDIEVGAS